MMHLVGMLPFPGAWDAWGPWKCGGGSGHECQRGESSGSPAGALSAHEAPNSGHGRQHGESSRNRSSTHPSAPKWQAFCQSSSAPLRQSTGWRRLRN